MAVTFESYERRIDQIKPVMEKYGIKDFEDALNICKEKAWGILKSVDLEEEREDIDSDLCME